MSDANKRLRQSALVMKIMGWGLIVGSVPAALSMRLDSFGGVFRQDSHFVVHPILLRLLTGYTPTFS
jgi:hypothetical protein